MFGILLLILGWYYEVNLGRDSEARLVRILNFKFSEDADVWLRFLVDA